MAELLEQSQQLLAFEEPTPKVYPHQIAFNVLPHIDQREPFQSPEVVPLLLNVIVSYVYTELPKH